MYDNFEVARKRLLAEVIEGNKESFKNDFLKLVQLGIALLMEKDDNFFALFMIQVERKVKSDLPTPIATKITSSGFIMYFNPNILLECSLPEFHALIKHEIYHLLSGHYLRAKKIKNYYSPLAINIAMDISINQYIKNLPPWSERLENVKMAYHVDLKEEQSMEDYAKFLQEAIDKIKKEKLTIKDEALSEVGKYQDSSMSHDLWNENDGMLEEKDINNLTIKTVQNAIIRSGKNVPKVVEKYMDEVRKKSEISWKEYLSRIIGTVPKGYKKTITRKNRRQPERLDLRGTLTNHEAQIIVAIDISGSITDMEIEQIMVEVFAIVKNHSYEICIIECDSEIRRIYKVKNIRDIKKKMNTKGNTRFSPVFEYLNVQKKRNCILIYFTDGLGEKELIYKPINYKTIWILTGRGEKLSLNNPYGIIKRLSNVEYEKPDITYMKNEMKEYVAEWAGK